jgi:hypothetical protein
MRVPSRLAAVLLACLVLVAAAAAPAAHAEELDFKPMFNGKDLSGWVPVNVAPNTFTVKDGVIHSTGVPTGVMRTERQYENFVIELEWMHERPAGNAGLFVWGEPMTAQGTPFAKGIEVQILDHAYVTGDALAKNLYTGHGDIFPIHGATMVPDRPHPAGWDRCLPSENRAKPAGQWNHYRVEARDGTIKLSVNGKEVSGGTKCSPRKGYLCLESEGSPAQFRNVRIAELPSSNPKPEETAGLDEGFTSLYTGVDLANWQADPGHKGHWVPRDWVLAYDGKSEAQDKNLWSEKEYGDFVLIADWRFSGKPKPTARPVILPSGEDATNPDGSKKTEEVPDAGDSGIYLRGSSKSQVNMWCWPAGSGEVYGYRTDPKQPAEVRAGVTPKLRADRPVGEWNRFVITMKGDRLTVVLNGKTVIENAQLPDVPARGKIALQHHGDPIEFSNIFIRELE